MKRNILIAIVVLLSVVMAAEIGFLIYQGAGMDSRETTGETMGETSQTNQTAMPSETQSAEIESVPGTTEGENEVPVITVPQNTEEKKPAGSTDSQPADTTQPEQTTEETRNDGLDENELPPIPV